MPNEIIEQPVNISRVSVKAPPFWRSNPGIWFKQMESQFSLAGVTTEITKFHHVVSALQPEELVLVSDIILKPPEDNPYETLKSRLCSQYAESEEQQWRDLISGIQLGDRKPSRLLLEMRGKAGSRIDEKLLKSLFLQRLPTHVQQILAISNDGLDKLAEMADGIMTITPNSTVIQAVNTERGDLHDTLMDIETRLAKLETLSRSRFRSPKRRITQRSSSKDSDDMGQCWYHRKFKQRATKCLKPCSFVSEN